MTLAYDQIIAQLNAFIKKYYANQLLRGLLVLLICVLLFLLSVSLGEYFLYFPVTIKIILVTFFVFFGLLALIVWIIIPLTKMYSLGKILSHEQAAAIVGKHFSEVEDKLINVLQLKSMHNTSESYSLVEASIQQKSAQLAVIPMTKAINLAKNKKYLRFLLPLIFTGIVILWAVPNLFKEATNRLLQPTQAFSKPAPFSFEISSLPLQVVKNADYTLMVSVKGKSIPNEVYLEVNGEKIKMINLPNNQFKYILRNVNDPIRFRFFGAGFYSQNYTLNISQKPFLHAVAMQINYPSYTGRKNEIRTSLSDVTIPIGTQITWLIAADFTDQIIWQWKNAKGFPLAKIGTSFTNSFKSFKDSNYTLILFNNQSKIKDSVSYAIHIIPDQFPTVQAKEFHDTNNAQQIVFSGTAGDDYALRKVDLHLTVSNTKGNLISSKLIPLSTQSLAVVSFQYYLDLQALNLQPGDVVNYYAEAWDNDAINGSKSTRSEVMSYRMFLPKELDSVLNKNAKQINSGLSHAADQAKKIDEQMNEAQNKLLESNDMDFSQQQQFKELADKQETLKQQLENTQKKIKEQVKNSEQKKYSEELKEKQEDLQKQMDNLLNNELKEQMKKLDELRKKLNKDQAMQSLQKMEEDNKVFAMDMERMKEQMKQMEKQMRMEDLANKIETLAQKQNELKQATDLQKKQNNDLKKDQENLKNELNDALQKDMKELQDLNKQTEQKQDLNQPQQAGKNAQKSMEESEKKLGENKNNSASKSQQEAKENLQQMADMLRKQAGGMDIEQIDIDIKATRQLLTNLIRLSFDQERLMNQVYATAPTTKQYLNNQTEQFKLFSNAKMIKDSLFQLSKRISKLSTSINKETTELELKMKATIAALEDRRIAEAAMDQQYVMMRTNNLALMLNELLTHLLEQKSKSEKEGSKGSCKNPGGKKPSNSPGKQMSDIITQQEKLGNSMQKMGQAAQKGKGEAGKKGEGEKGKEGNKGMKGDGKTGGQGNEGAEGADGENGNAEQIARLAQQQSQIRKQIQELQNQLNSKGLGNSKELQDAKDKMDKNETDLVNKRFSSDFFQRQHEILTRLLEAEKAIRQQDQDDKRASNTGQNIPQTIPQELQKYLLEQQKLLESYQTFPPQLKPYYKSLVEEYYKKMGISK